MLNIFRSGSFREAMQLSIMPEEKNYPVYGPAMEKDKTVFYVSTKISQLIFIVL